MTWGHIETFSLDLLLEVFAENRSLLEALVASDKKIWGGRAAKLLKWIDSETRRDSRIKNKDAIRSFVEPLSVNLTSIQRLYGTIFSNDPDVVAALRANELRVLSARRHLILHRAGVVDQEYVDQSGEALPLGSGIKVTPQDLVSYFRSAVRIVAAMARAATRSFPTN